MSNIIIKREYKNIGWISGIKFIDLDTKSPIFLRSYNGCLCFLKDKKRIGYSTWKRESKIVNLPFQNSCPF